MKYPLWFALVGLIMGVFITFNTSTAFIDGYNDILTNEQKIVFETLQNEQSILKNQIITLRKQIEAWQSELKQMGRYEDIVEEISVLKKKVGLTEQRGKGVEIVLDDSAGVNRTLVDINNDALVHAADIRDIINVLRFSKAKAISVNDQRILANTPINCVGNNILINNEHFVPPIIIRAIGDQQVMLNNINYSFNLKNLKDRVKKTGMAMIVHSDLHLIIPMYNSDLIVKYIR